MTRPLVHPTTRPRVAIGGISHETNTFLRVPTDLALFARRTLLRGPAIVQGSRGVRSALGGMVDAALDAGWELAPAVFASAMPGGRVRRGTFESLAGELVVALRRAAPLDGVLLALHGAMVAEGYDDADGELLRRVRATIGPDVPVAVVVDSHANLTPAMAQHADILLGYDTYPHVDTDARGREATALLARMLAREVRPVHALRQLPLLAPLPAQRSDCEPLASLLALAHAIEAEPGILAVTLAPGFPYSDIRDAGLAVLVTADDDRALAARHADALAAACWASRHQLTTTLTPLAGAVAAARGWRGPGPLLLADVADNPGAGAAGDGTAVLAALLTARVPGVALATIADPAAALRALELGVEGEGEFRLGGHTDGHHGAPLRVRARVRWVGDLAYIHGGPMGAGALSRLGTSAVLELGDPPALVIVSANRAQALDPELFRAAGIAPEAQRVLVVKSSVHFRAAFASLAGEIIEVDAPGIATPHLATLPWRKLRRPIWPLDAEMLEE